MRCPVDKKDMIVVEHQNIELDYCLQCSGVWFDASELELLIEALKRQGAQITQGDLITTQKANAKEAARKCPHCGTKMNKGWMGKEPRVLIDSCQRGHGLWFDGGELHQILCQLEPADKQGTKDILSFLGDTFKADCKK
jgi:Zn-finger nucleic acid-binding protein